jgi:hypothetical protein
MQATHDGVDVEEHSNIDRTFQGIGLARKMDLPLQRPGSSPTHTEESGRMDA